MLSHVKIIYKMKKMKKDYLNLLNPCRVCPRECKNNRLANEKTGFCKMGRKAQISSAHAHFGEEKCLVGTNGSGTIFFSSCNLACVYCQNFEVSQFRQGKEISAKRLAQIMLDLQNQGCHNINFVTPSIWVPQILEGLKVAKKEGLDISLVYNTGGYDSIKSLKMLAGIIDIYMPDIKYSSDEVGEKYSLVPDYWTKAKKAIKEMHSQVGNLVIDENGLAKKGLLIRHLVLPNNIAGSKKVFEFLAKEISKNTYVNIIDQYLPTYKANECGGINRPITSKELKQAYIWAEGLGLYRLDEKYRQ